MIRIIFILLCLAASALAEPLSLRFSPPDSIEFVTAMTDIRFRELGEERSAVDTIFVLSRDRIERTGTGYRMVTRVDSMYTSRDGVEASTPVNDAYGEVAFETVLDSTGRAVAFHGYDEVDRYLQAHTDSAAYATLQRALNYDALTQKELDIWNGRIDRLQSGSIQPGEMYLEEVDIALPQLGNLTMYGVTHFVDTLRVDSVLLGKMLLVQNTNLDEVAARLGLTPDEMCEQFSLADSVLTQSRAQAEMSGGGLATNVAMVFELETLLLISETTEVIVSMNVTDPSGGRKVGKVYDLKTKTLEYQR